MRRDTLLDLFTAWSSLNAPFLVYDDRYRRHAWRYRDVASAAQSAAAHFHAIGLQPGDHVLVWSENRPEWIVALWACLLSGVVAVPLDYRASGSFLLRVQQITQAKLLLYGDEVQLPENLPVPAAKLSTQEAWTTDGTYHADGITRDTLAEVLFTSGATAEPKGVTITHRNLLANIVPVEHEILKYLHYAKPFQPIRFLNLLPLSHLFGQTMAAFIPPVLPGIVYFRASQHPQEITRQIQSERISVLVCVPKMLELLRDYVRQVVPASAEPAPAGEHWARRWWRYREVHRLLGWKFWAFIVGAAPLDPELEAFWSGLGYVVVQGYGLTETAPMVTLNHPFHTRKGSVGKPIAGVEIRIAEDGEILVRGENVSTGYLQEGGGRAALLQDGWFHTGDVGEMDAEGRLSIKGRKKEMIVTPEGLNVFPDDVERVLQTLAGVQEAAVVGAGPAGQERVHAVLVLAAGAHPDAVLAAANTQLEPHQQVRGYTVWPQPQLPRTEGTRKLRRRELRDWVSQGGDIRAKQAATGDALTETLALHTQGRAITDDTQLAALGLSSLERVQMMMDLEERYGTTLDETQYGAACTVADLRALVQQPVLPGPAQSGSVETFVMPAWNRSAWARGLRRASLPSWVLPLAGVFARVQAHGLEHLRDVPGPVLFASNHQSFFDTPVILKALPSRWRYRVAPAMSKEFFDAHFNPQRHTSLAYATSSLNYGLASLFFAAFPLPQREAGMRHTLRYAGELVDNGWSILLFPEGRHAREGGVESFLPGVAMLASKLQIPVVPVRLRGVDQVLHPTWRWPRRGRVQVSFGKPLQLTGDDLRTLARQVEDAVRAL